MEIRIDQLAIAPKEATLARQLIKALGHLDWSDDEVLAKGFVRGEPGQNKAKLAFNYTFVPGVEFEILDYVEGPNFVEGETPCAAHLGVHVKSSEEMCAIKELMAELNIDVVQEVNTISHTNPAIAGKRRYNYVIFRTRHIIGLDLKFILRLVD